MAREEIRRQNEQRRSVYTDEELGEITLTRDEAVLATQALSLAALSLSPDDPVWALAARLGVELEQAREIKETKE